MPSLVACLKDPDREVRRETGWALRHIHQRPDLVVPALVEALGHPDPDDRRQAAIALGTFGPAAKDAVSALHATLADSYKTVRDSASNALLKIAPETLANAQPAPSQR